MTADKVRLIDVGARDGIDVRWKDYWTKIDVIAFEPDPVECARLNAQKHPYPIQYLPNALGATNNETATLHLTQQPGCSSLLKPNHVLCDQFSYGPAMTVVKEIPLTVNRMDSVVTVQPDVIKIDTQGTELDVLKGAGALLDHTMAVEMEVEFVPQYVNQPLFADVDSFMRGRGFMLRGIRRTYWRNKAAAYTHASGGQLIHGDALYIRQDAMNNAKGHVILAAYRQYDLLTHFGATHLVPQASKGLQFVGKLLGKTNRELRQIVDRMRPVAASDWHDPDFF